jgi:hypothetical protein
MNINSIRKLAKEVKMLNLFNASKEINGIRLFHNETDLSKIQELFISYLYFYYNINMDINMDKVSKKVLDNEIYEDSYYRWKNKNVNKEIVKKDNTDHNVHLVF